VRVMFQTVMGLRVAAWLWGGLWPVP
jgi:hypothetical protein